MFHAQFLALFHVVALSLVLFPFHALFRARVPFLFHVVHARALFLVHVVHDHAIRGTNKHNEINISSRSFY